MPQLTEKIKVKIDHECKDFPIFLTWLNSLGGYSYWLFFKSHTESIKTKSENSYIVNIQDLENAISTNDITGKSSIPSLAIGAVIDAEDMDGIQSLFQSPKVLQLMNPETWQTEGLKYRRVIVNAGSLIILKTKIERLEVKFTLELPFINTQKE